MPKPMPIRLQVEEVAFGRIFRLLSEMQGVVSIDIDASGPKTKAPRAARGSAAKGTSSVCIILAALMAKPLSRKDLEAAIVGAGKKASTLNGALGKASADKLVKPAKGGFWAIVPAGKRYLATKCEVGS